MPITSPLWARFGTEPPPGGVYNNVDTRSDSGVSDAELGNMAEMQLPRGPDGVLIAPYLRDSALGASRCNGFTQLDVPTTSCYQSSVDGTESPPSANGGAGVPGSGQSPSCEGGDGMPVDPRQLSVLVGNGGGAMSKARMAEIAAAL